MYFGTGVAGHRDQLWDYRRFHFFDEMKVWCSTSARQDLLPEAADNTLILSESFWKEIEAHPIPIDMTVVRELTNNPGCLDLYMWLVWRCHVAKGTQSIPLFGNCGLANQLGVPEYSRDRNFRKRIRTWLRTVGLFWPGCPARMSDDGLSLIVAPGSAITPARAKVI
jgi:hypothetical protein